MVIDDISGDDELKIVQPKGKPVTSSNTHAKILAQLTGSGRGWFFVATRDHPSGIIRAEYYREIFDKRYRPMLQAYSGDAYIYVYEKPRPQQRSNGCGSGTSTKSTPNATITERLIADMAAKNEAMAAYNRGEKPLKPYRPHVAGNAQDEKPSVLTSKPKKDVVITRGLRGIDIDGTTLNANNLELTWTGNEAGSESLSSKWDKWDKWDGILPIRTGDFKLTATVSGGTSHTVAFSVILKPVITAYTAEDIELLNTFVWGEYNKSPESILIHDLAIAAGLVDKKDGFTETLTGKKVTDKVKAFANNAHGDFNVFYSGSGDKAFIEKKVNTLFGTHLSDETRATFVEKLEAKKNAGFIDATSEFHEAMNNTLNIFFAKNSIGRTIAELEVPLSVNPTLMLMMDAAKTVVNVKLNIELGLESNGAPLVMRHEANKQLFDMVAMDVGGVVLKVGSSAFKVVKSYFGKFKHKFSKKGRFKTNGIIIKDPLTTKQGGELFLQLRKADLSTTNKDLLRRTKSLLSSGTQLPEITQATSGTILYKFVPKGSTVTKHTPYFISEKELLKLKSNPNLIADKMALPKVSEASSYDVYKITPKSGNRPTIFVSQVASTTEGSVIRKGGGIQTIVANRNDWKTAKFIETIGN